MRAAYTKEIYRTRSILRVGVAFDGPECRSTAGGLGVSGGDDGARYEGVFFDGDDADVDDAVPRLDVMDGEDDGSISPARHAVDIDDASSPGEAREAAVAVVPAVDFDFEEALVRGLEEGLAEEELDGIFVGENEEVEPQLLHVGHIPVRFVGFREPVCPYRPVAIMRPGLGRDANSVHISAPCARYTAFFRPCHKGFAAEVVVSQPICTVGAS